MSPPPVARGVVDPNDEHFTGFVFKIQANMDPRHRDRIAFVRVCSGKFERDMTVRNARTGKDVRLARAMKLFADERESLEAAFAGDVVGLANPGVFAIGDTLYEGAPVVFPPIPSFAPEHFALVRSIDTASYKSFGKGIAQLREEGAVQSSTRGLDAYRADPRRRRRAAIRGREVSSRIGIQREDHVSNATVYARAASGPFDRLRTGSRGHVARNCRRTRKLVEDWEGHPMALFESEWSVRLAQEWNPALTLLPYVSSGGRIDVKISYAALLAMSAALLLAGCSFENKYEQRGRQNHSRVMSNDLTP